MKKIAWIIVLILGLIACEDPEPKPEYRLQLAAARAEPRDAAAIMFCIDTSGSMDGNVGGAKKIAISKTVLTRAALQIDEWLAAHPGKTVLTGLCRFSSTAEVVVPLQVHDAAKLREGARALEATGGTALGSAIELAAVELDRSGATGHRAIVALADGENNDGPRPADVMAAIAREQLDVDVALVAFDVEGMTLPGARVVESRSASSVRAVFADLVDEVLLEKER